MSTQRRRGRSTHCLISVEPEGMVHLITDSHFADKKTENYRGWGKERDQEGGLEVAPLAAGEGRLLLL